MKAEFHISLKDAAGLCGGTVMAGDPAILIKSVSSDSRDLGEASLFVPLVGERFDGHDFIARLAAEKKIAAFLTMKKEHAEITDSTGVPAVLCADTLAALGSLASGHRQRVNSRVIGITGTNGKTTTKELLHALLSPRYNTLKNIKNYNNEIGVPFTLLSLEPGHEFAVIEMGMNHSGELDRLSRIVRPDISVITNVGEGHLEFLGSVENVAYAKAEIMHGMKPGSVIFVNRDSICFDILMGQAEKFSLRVKTFGLDTTADIFPSAYRLLPESIEVVVSGVSLKAPLCGIHNVYNLLAALSVVLELGMDAGDIQASLDSFENISGRSQIINREYSVIDDTYNANPLSTKYALRSISEIFPDRRKIAVLSDMKELGAHAPSYHFSCGREAVERGVELLYLWGEMAQEYRKGALKAGMPEESLHVFESKDDLSRSLKKEIRSGDVILVKGSRSMKMEEIVRDITG